MSEPPEDFADATAASVDEERERLLARLDQVTTDIRAIFRQDLPDFVERTVRSYFLDHVEVSSGLDRGRIAALKQGARERGAAFAREVDRALADRDRWLAGLDVPEAQRTRIDQVPEVWSVVERVVGVVEGLLEEAGYPRPEGGYGIVYTPPARFVGGKYLKGLVEHYARILSDLAQIDAQQRARVRARTRAELARRWEDA